MASEVRSLPIFPLNTVLYPKGTLPLQIFEERYRLMLEYCLEADSKFGVVLIKHGPEVGGTAVPYSVGTVAQIIQVNPAKEGRMFISVYGTDRFKIREITQVRPYMKADVEVFPDADENDLPEDELAKIRETVAAYVRLKLGLRRGWNRDVPLPDDPHALSYYTATVMKVEPAQKQALLEEPSTSRRLQHEAEWLSRARVALKAQVARELLLKRFGRQ